MNLKKLIKVPHEGERDRHRESERQAKLTNMCVATLVRAGVCVSVSVPVRGESLTPAMPLLKTTSGWGIKRRHWSLGKRGVEDKGPGGTDEL